MFRSHPLRSPCFFFNPRTKEKPNYDYLRSLMRKAGSARPFWSLVWWTTDFCSGRSQETGVICMPNQREFIERLVADSPEIPRDKEFEDFGAMERGGRPKSTSGSGLKGIWTRQVKMISDRVWYIYKYICIYTYKYICVYIYIWQGSFTPPGVTLAALFLICGRSSRKGPLQHAQALERNGQITYIYL